MSSKGTLWSLRYLGIHPGQYINYKDKRVNHTNLSIDETFIFFKFKP